MQACSSLESFQAADATEKKRIYDRRWEVKEEQRGLDAPFSENFPGLRLAAVPLAAGNRNGFEGFTAGFVLLFY